MSKEAKDYISQFHDYGIYLPTKTLMLTGEVDQLMLDTCLCNLHILDSSVGEVTIKLISDGGSVSVARAIYDLIRGMKNLVRIQCYGNISSAATLILQAADRRVMSPNSKMMLHLGYEGVAFDHPRTAERTYKENRAEEEWMYKVYLERIKEKKKRYTRKQLEDLLLFDTYLSPKECVELGLADEVGEIQ